MDPELTIIVPTLNEAENVRPLVRRISAVLDDTELRSNGQILFADGGSDDGTPDEIASISDDENVPDEFVRCVSCPDDGSLAEDVLYAAEQTKSPIVTVMDADLSHPPEVLPDLIHAIRDGSCDVAIGSRYVEGGSVPDWPVHRRLISSLATGLAGLFTDVQDPLSGFFAIDREVLLDRGRDAKGFKILFEIIGSDPDLTCREVPITFRDRDRGASKFRWPEAVAFAHQCFSMVPVSCTGARRPVSLLLAALIGMILDAGAGWLLRDGPFILPVAEALRFLVGILPVLVLLHRDREKVSSEGGVWNHLRLVFLSLAFAVLTASAANAGLAAMEASRSLRFIARWLAGGTALLIVFSLSAAPPAPETRHLSYWNLTALGCGAFVLFLRFSYSGAVDLIPEEAYYWSYAQHPALAYLDHPPLVAWSILTSTSLLGSSEFAVRLPAFLFWCISAYYLYRLSTDFFSRSTGLHTVLTYLVLPIVFGIQFLTTPDAPLMAAWAGMLYYLWHAYRRNHLRSWLLAGFFLGVGLLSKYTILLLVPPCFLLFVLDPERRVHFLRPHPYLGLLTAFILFLPVLIWNAQNGYASFVFQGPRRFLGPSEGFATGRFLLSLLVLLTPTVALAAAWTLSDSIRTLFTKADGQNDTRSIHFFVTLMTVLPLSVFLLKSLQGPIKPNWTAPVWIAVLPHVAHLLHPARRPEGWIRSWWTTAWKSTLIGAVLLYGTGLFYLTAGAPGVPVYKKHNMPIVWEQVARHVESIAGDLVDEGHPKPIVVGANHYYVTSEMAFYLRNAPTVAGVDGRDLFGDTSLMWEKWPPPVSPRGRPVIIVSSERDDLQKGFLKRYVHRLEPIYKRRVRLHGRVISTFFYRIGYDYHSCSDCSPTHDFVPLDRFLQKIEG